MTTDDLRRLTACLNLLQSDKDGEVVAAARAANRMLAKYNMTWGSFWYDLETNLRQRLMETEPTIDDAFRELEKTLRPSQFRNFILDLRKRWMASGTLSEKQREVVRNAIVRNGINLW